MTVWPGLLILFIYLLWYCREQPLTRSLELSTDGIALPETEDQDAALALLPAGYEFLNYRYTISGCSLSTFHRDVTSSPYAFQTRHPVYTLICYENEGDLLTVVPGSHRSVPFVWGRALTINSRQGKAVLFQCDILHAGALTRNPERKAVQYKLAHQDDLPLLEGLQGIDVDKRERVTISLRYEWICRKLSQLFPFLINHVFTRHLQQRSDSPINRALVALFGRSFYNR
ncbi:MAG: hypothetical protein ACO3JU_10275 [Pseudohongiellaceae bacterium]